MSRDLHANTLAVLDNQNLQVFHLVTFYFTVPFRLTDHVHDINYDFGAGTETFTSNARLTGSANIEETLEISNPTINIILTGANTADLALPFSEDFNDARVVVRRGFFNNTGETTDSDIIADPFILFEGRADSFSISDDPSSGESSVTWKIVSHWADWGRVNGRKCNNQQIQSHNGGEFPNEEGFSHCYDQIGDKLWGKVIS